MALTGHTSLKVKIKEVDLTNKIYNKYDTPIKDLYTSNTVVSIRDRKIKIIKRRDGERGEINNINKLADLVSELLLNFIHPVYLPTLDEAIKEKIGNDVKELLRRYIREPKNEMPNM